MDDLPCVLNTPEDEVIILRAFHVHMKFSDIFNAMMTELSRQGNNLNQIAHGLNSMVTEDVGCRQDYDKLSEFISGVLKPFIEDFSTFKKDFRERCFHVLDEMIKKG